MAKVLLTGASGFIGAHLTEALAARGDQVTCLVRRTSRVDQLRALGAALVYGDVTDIASLRAALPGAEVVYHLAGCTAAVRTADFYRVNTAGTANVAGVCAQQSRPPVLVVVSTQAAAGPAPLSRPRVETDRPVQVSHYGRSKRMGERAAQRLAECLPISVVRPPIVLGQWDHVGLDMFRWIAYMRTHIVPGLGRHHFSVIHAADLAQLLILAAERGARLLPLREGDASRAQGFYFAASETNPAYADLGRMIGRALGRRRVATFSAAKPAILMVAAGSQLLGRLLGRPLFLNLDKAAEIEAGSWVCSAQAARQQLGFSVAAPLEDRLRQTARWYREVGWL
jgi:dihydroflavonol-4-reductase